MKYQTFNTDFGALARELHGGEDIEDSADAGPIDEPELDKWADYDPSRD